MEHTFGCRPLSRNRSLKGVESDVPEAQDMGPLPPYTGDQPDETTLSPSKKLILLVVALVVFHLIAVVSK